MPLNRHTPRRGATRQTPRVSLRYREGLASACARAALGVPGQLLHLFASAPGVPGLDAQRHQVLTVGEAIGHAIVGDEPIAKAQDGAVALELGASAERLGKDVR